MIGRACFVLYKREACGFCTRATVKRGEVEIAWVCLVTCFIESNGAGWRLWIRSFYVLGIRYVSVCDVSPLLFAKRRNSSDLVSVVISWHVLSVIKHNGCAWVHDVFGKRRHDRSWFVETPVLKRMWWRQEIWKAIDRLPSGGYPLCYPYYTSSLTIYATSTHGIVPTDGYTLIVLQVGEEWTWSTDTHGRSMSWTDWSKWSTGYCVSIDVK